MLQEKHKQHQTVVAALAQAQAQAQAAAGAGAAAPGGAAVFVSPRSAHLSSQMQDDDLMTLALMPTMNNKLVSSKNVSTALVVKSLEQKVQGLQAQLDEKDATIQEKEETADGVRGPEDPEGGPGEGGLQNRDHIVRVAGPRSDDFDLREDTVLQGGADQ